MQEEHTKTTMKSITSSEFLNRDAFQEAVTFAGEGREVKVEGAYAYFDGGLVLCANGTTALGPGLEDPENALNTVAAAEIALRFIRKYVLGTKYSWAKPLEAQYGKRFRETATGWEVVICSGVAVQVDRAKRIKIRTSADYPATDLLREAIRVYDDIFQFLLTSTLKS